MCRIISGDNGENASSNKKFHYGWVIVTLGLIANIGAHGLGRLSYSVILPQMAEALQLNWTEAGLLGTANLTGYLIFSLLGGSLASRYGTRKVMTYSLIVVGVTLFLTGLSTNFYHALFLRFLTGLGNGGVYIPAMALGSIWFSQRHRGLATGIAGAGPGMGIFVSGLILPPILFSSGWNSAWHAMGLLVLAVYVLCFFFLRDHSQEKAQIEQKKKSASSGDWRFVYRHKGIRSLGLVYMMYGLAYAGYATFFHAFLTKEIGLPVAQAAYMWTFAGGMSLFAAVMWGGVSDKLGRKYTMSLVYLINAASYSLFFFSDSASGFYLSAILFGLGLGSIPTIVAASAADQVGVKLTSTAMGLLTAFFGVGQLIGPALGGFLADYTGSFRLAFAFASLAAVTGSVGSLLLKKPQQPPLESE